MSLSDIEGRVIAYYHTEEGEKVKIYVNRSPGIREIFIRHGGVKLCPSDDPQERDTLYISGPTGSGKTHFACGFINDFLEQNENSDVIVITPKEKDKTIDCNLDPEIIDYVNAEEKDDEGNYRIVSEELTHNDLEDSITFFDDILAISNPKLKQYVINLNETAIKVGREKRVSTITTSHLLRNWRETRLLINDSKYIVVFPESGPKYPIFTYLKDIIGMDKKRIEEILQIKTSWLVICQKAPQAIVHERGVMIL